MTELLDNTGYAWAFIAGGILSFDWRVFFGVLAVWTLAGLYHEMQYDPTEALR